MSRVERYVGVAALAVIVVGGVVAGLRFAWLGPTRFDPTTAPSASEPRPSAISELKFERTGCFGKCPVYSVSFFRDGRAVYDGRAHVERIGRFVGKVDFPRLAAWLESQGVHDFPGERQRFADTQAAVIEVVTRSGRRCYTYTDTPSEKIWGVIKVFEGVVSEVSWVPEGGTNG